MHGADKSAAMPEAAERLLLNDKSEYTVTKEQVEHWQELYPTVDVM